MSDIKDGGPTLNELIEQTARELWVKSWGDCMGKQNEKRMSLREAIEKFDD